MQPPRRYTQLPRRHTQPARNHTQPLGRRTQPPRRGMHDIEWIFWVIRLWGETLRQKVEILIYLRFLSSPK